jgi:hypothetical protein
MTHMFDQNSSRKLFLLHPNESPEWRILARVWIGIRVTIAHENQISSKSKETRYGFRLRFFTEVPLAEMTKQSQILEAGLSKAATVVGAFLKRI